MTDSVERTLGRILGTQDEIKNMLSAHIGEFHAHQKQDIESIAILAKAIGQQRNLMDAGFKEQDRARNQHLNEQDLKLDALKEDSDRAKGAGWVILGLFATFAGSAVLAVIALISGKLHWS